MSIIIFLSIITYFNFLEFVFLVGLHVHCKPRQLRHGNVSPAGGMGETKGNVHRHRKTVGWKNDLIL